MINDYFFSIEDIMELLFGEALIFPRGYSGFEFSHAVEVAQ